jgi:DegV family protein with EDD domain
MSYQIVTDSSANLTDEIITQFGLEIISLIFRVGDKEYYSYTKGEVTNIKQYYEMMRQGDTITTAQVSIDPCREAFESILKQGNDVLYIGFSSALSGTFSVADMVARELQEEYPERKMYSVDTLAASMGEGLLVYHAAMQKLAGKTIDEVRDWLINNRLNLCHWFTVDDLVYLKRGGRISATTALLGTIMGIKPIMHVDDEGRLVPTGKIRGRRQSLEELVKQMQNTCINPAEQMIFITHGDCIDDAQYVEKLVRERLNVKDVKINYVDPVIGAHSGPGTIALFFIGSKR